MATARALRGIFLSVGLIMQSISAGSAASLPAIRIAAAADLASCIDPINTAFAKNVGAADVKASIGSSGNFYAQIKQGAPFDVFLSADMQYPRELAKAGLADSESLVVYAHGQLIMWTTDPLLDPGAGMQLLRDPRVTHVAIANPDVAPYGRAAKAALERAGVWDAIKPKLIFGENIAQTAQFIETGNAQVGFVGSTYLKANDGIQKGRVWPVPNDLYPLIEQGGIVTAAGKSNPLARKYLDFLHSASGQSVLQKCGLSVPEVGK